MATFTNSSSGSLVLNAPYNTATSATLVNNGSVVVQNQSSLQVSGDAHNSGTIRTGHDGCDRNDVTIAGTLTNSGAFTMNRASDTVTVGSLNFVIAGSGPGQYDQLSIGGQAQVNGLLAIDLIDGFVPRLGDTFEKSTSFTSFLNTAVAHFARLELPFASS